MSNTKRQTTSGEFDRYLQPLMIGLLAVVALSVGMAALDRSNRANLETSTIKRIPPTFFDVSTAPAAKSPVLLFRDQPLFVFNPEIIDRGPGQLVPVGLDDSRHIRLFQDHDAARRLREDGSSVWFLQVAPTRFLEVTDVPPA